MLKNISIKSLYTLALAEGEGVGTAYEYYAKRLLLSRWLKQQQPPRNLIVAGLPQKYGASMDFLYLAAELNAPITIIDNRQEALDRCRSALKMLQDHGLLKELTPTFVQVKELTNPVEVSQKFDLVLTCEVLQQMPQERKQGYLNTLLQLSSQAVLFTPNGDNTDHTSHSGLQGVKLQELREMVDRAIKETARQNLPTPVDLGYIDMPPFPPGITRSEDQRRQATSGKLEAAVMIGLGYYARMERLFPKQLRKKKSHIVYATISGDPR